MNNKAMYEVVYVGAPYGENEYGEVLSRYRSYEAADATRVKLQDQARYYGTNVVIKYNFKIVRGSVPSSKVE